MRSIFGIFFIALILPLLGCGRGPATLPNSEEVNMREIYRWLAMYKNSHKQSYPPKGGQAFILELWQSGVMEHNEVNASRFFSAAEPFEEYLKLTGLDPSEITFQGWVAEWEAKQETGYINYAAFDPQGEPGLMKRLQEDPASVTILSNATFSHRDVIFYMTGDGVVHQLNITKLLDTGVLSLDHIDMGYIPVGADSPIEQLRTVSND